MKNGQPYADTVINDGEGYNTPLPLFNLKGMILKMAEYVTLATQTVALNQNVLFIDSANCSRNCNIMHRGGSGIVTLRGSNSCCNPAKYEVNFSGNIAIAEDGTVEPISVAIALEGEPLYASTATVTPAAIGDFFNVSTTAIISVPCGCCFTIAVENVSTTTAIDVSNANLTVSRIC